MSLSVLDLQTLAHLFSYLDYEACIRLHATGSHSFRSKLLRHHVGIVDDSTLPYIKSVANFVHALYNKWSCKLEDVELFVPMFPRLTKLQLAIGDNMTDEFVQSLPVTLKWLDITSSTLRKLSFISHLTSLRTLKLTGITEYDVPFSTTLAKLCITNSINGLKKDHRAFEVIGNSRLRTINCSNWVNCKALPCTLTKLKTWYTRFAIVLSKQCPNLTYLRVAHSYDPFEGLPPSLTYLSTNNIEYESELAERYPNLRTLNITDIDYNIATIPKSLTHLIAHSAVPKEKLTGMRVDMEFLTVDEDGFTEACTGVELHTATGRLNELDFSVFPTAKILNLGIVHLSSAQLPEIIEYFPPFVTELNIDLGKFSISSLENLPNCIRDVKIMGIISQANINLTNKAHLFALQLVQSDTYLPSHSKIVLPKSLIVYRNDGALLTNRDLPLPKLNELTISLDDDFTAWHRLPITLHEFRVCNDDHIGIYGIITSGKYTPIKGYTWDYQ